MDLSLKDKIALITGASSGIGRETALRFASHGASVALFSRDRAALQQVARQIEQNGGNALVTAGDVTRVQDCQAALQQTRETFGRLDILVNAAGIYRGGSLAETSLETWKDLQQVNVDAVFRMMQLALPDLQKTRGNIVNVSSVAGLRAFANILAYAVSKAAVDQLTRCAALELAPSGIRVNAVNPGVVVTDLHRRGGMEEKAYLHFLEHSKSTHPLGRVGQPVDVAEAIVFLASDQADWITGVTLSVDGGRQLTCAR